MSEKYRPEQIYLQVTDDDGEALDVDTEEITWCADDQHQGDIKYIRADIVRKLEAVVEATKREPTFAELLRMGRTLRWWMRHWNDVGDFRTGMKLAILQWRELLVNGALATLEAHDAE